jgi:hypothetical protein
MWLEVMWILMREAGRDARNACAKALALRICSGACDGNIGADTARLFIRFRKEACVFVPSEMAKLWTHTLFIRSMQDRLRKSAGNCAIVPGSHTLRFPPSLSRSRETS